MARHRAIEPADPVLPGSGGAVVMLGVRLLLSAAVMAAGSALASLFVWTLLPLAVGWSPSVVLTGSMLPTIRPGDIVVAAPISDGEAAAPGHVLRFADPARPGRYLLHRVIEVENDGTYVTKGDANQSADSTPVPQSAVTGMARLRVPLVGLPVVWVRDGDYLPLGLSVLGLLAAGQLLASLRSTVSPEPDVDDEPQVEALSAAER